MTALNFLVHSDAIYIAIDTLSISADKRTPRSYMTKYVVLPHLHTIVTGTGYAPLISEWMSAARQHIIANDTDHLDQYTPDYLNGLATKFPELQNEDCTATVYHFGFSTNRDLFTSYAYRSTNDWVSEELKEGIGVKPARHFEFMQGDVLPDAFIKLIQLQRQEDISKPPNERIGIGGDIHFIIYNRDGINIKNCHRFTSYNEDYEVMCKHLTDQPPSS